MNDSRTFYLYFWHGANKSERQDVADMFGGREVKFDDSGINVIEVEASLTGVAEILMQAGYQVWFKPDRMNVMITKYNDFENFEL